MNESANITQLTPSRSSLWLNWCIARYGVNEQVREHGKAMLLWIMTYHKDQLVRETAIGMVRVLGKQK